MFDLTSEDCRRIVAALISDGERARATAGITESEAVQEAFREREARANELAEKMSRIGYALGAWEQRRKQMEVVSSATTD